MRAIWLASLLFFATPLAARPYTIDDMLKLQGYGAVEIDPAERWAVVERQRPYNMAPRYDLEGRTEHALSELYLVDLERPNGLTRAFPQDPDAGYQMAGFSPSGQRLAVLRITLEGLSLGIVDLLTRQVRWLPGAAELLEANPRPIWLDDDNLIFVTRTRGDLPVRYSSGDYGRLTGEALIRSREGRIPSVRVSGSGAYRNLSIADDVDTVVRVNLQSGAVAEIERGVITDLALSADRRKLAIVEAGPLIQPYLDRAVDPAFQTRRRRLVIEDLTSGKQVEPCSSCDVFPYLLAWSPRGAALLFYARRDDSDWREGQLYQATGEGAVPLLPAGLRPPISIVGGAAPIIRAGWAGETPIILGQRGTGAPSWLRLEATGPSTLPFTGADQLLLASPDTVLALSDGEMVRVRGRGARERTLTGIIGIAQNQELDFMSVGVRRLLHPGLRELPALIIGDRNKERVVGADPEAAAIIWSVEIPPDSTIMATGRRSGAVLYLAREANGVASLFIDSPQASARRLDTINRHLSDIDVPKRIVVRSTSPDGRQLTHWLTLPKGSSQAPLVVLPYPGLERGDRPAPIDFYEFRSYQNVALLVGAGYAVLQPSIPTEIAPDRQKTDFGLRGTMTEAARVPDDFATDSFYDDMAATVLGAVDAAIATGRIDPQRLAIYGHSYGGDAVAGIVTRTDRFDAAIASDGVYNLLGAYGAMYVRDAPELGLPTGMISWFEAGQGGLGAPPWREVQGYVSRSPYFAVERINTPLMLLHGDTDFLPVQNAEQMFTALHRLGRDSLLVRYAGEGHTLVSPANTRDRWIRMLSFLEQNLSGGSNQSRQ